MWNKEDEIIIVEVKLKKHRISLRYPEIKGLKNKEVEKNINALIQEEIYIMIVEEGYEEDYKKEFSGEYDIKLQTTDLLSLVIYLHSYSKGAAHGLTVLKAINIDLEDARIYQLQDIFTKDAKYIEKINKNIKNDIVKRDIPLLVEFETIDKNQDYFLTGDSLVIFFQLYEYTAYAYGIPKFAIPYMALEDMIDTEGPLKNIIV